VLLGTALVIVGSATLYYSVTGSNPIDLISGRAAAPSPFELGEIFGRLTDIAMGGGSRGSSPGAGRAGEQVIGASLRRGTSRIRTIILAARVVPGWNLGRICGPSSGSFTSEHEHCNAADLMCSLAVGAVLSQFLINAGRTRALPIHCVIWNRRIWTRESGFRSASYSGPSPHTDHVHVSAWPSMGGNC
jgi:hypothetical protein